MGRKPAERAAHPVAGQRLQYASEPRRKLDRPRRAQELASRTVSFIRISQEALYLVLLLSAPVLLASLAIGFLVSILQAATQVQDQSVGFVPKIVVVSGVLAIVGGLMGRELLHFTQLLWGHMSLI